MFTEVVLLIASFIFQAPTVPPQLGPQQMADGTKLTAGDISQFKARAEAGEAQAQLALGHAYDDGNGVQQNDQLAAKWYRKAGEQGSPEAQDILGTMYRMGRGGRSQQGRGSFIVSKGCRAKVRQGNVQLGHGLL